MLISIKKKFVFIANLKTASTSIKTVLEPFSDIALTKSEEGKHIPLRDIEKRFARVFDDLGRQNFLTFGVMRNPVDFVISLYNSHADDRFKTDSRLYTGDMNFDQFLAEWIENNFDQVQPQFTSFLNKSGEIGANYIISYEKLVDGLDYVASVIDVPALLKLPRENVSGHWLRRGDLSEKQLAWISRRFKEDEQFAAQFCDRRLSGNLVPSESSRRSATTGGTTSALPENGAISAASITTTRRERYANEHLPNQDTITALKQINQEYSLLVSVFDKDLVCRSPSGDTSSLPPASGAHLADTPSSSRLGIPGGLGPDACLIEPVSSSKPNGNAVTTAVADAAAVEDAVSMTTQIGADQLVTAAYKAVLGRPADPSGLQTYGKLFRGVSLPEGVERVVRDLLASAEFQSKRAVAGDRSNSPVDPLQIHAFTPEETRWVSSLVTGMNRVLMVRFRPDPGSRPTIHLRDRSLLEVDRK